MTHRLLLPKSILILCLSLSSLCFGQELFKQGVDFQILEGEPDSSLQLKEFFSYNCPHCYSFDSTITGFLKTMPKEYTFSRVPVTFGRKPWEMSAHVYALADLLSMTDQLHEKVFEQIHKLHKPFNNENDVKAFFVQNGVDEEKYTSVANSFSAKSKFASNELLTKKFKITSVPTIIVRDVYEIEVGKIDSSEKLSKLVDFLMRY